MGQFETNSSHSTLLEIAIKDETGNRFKAFLWNRFKAFLGNLICARWINSITESSCWRGSSWRGSSSSRGSSRSSSSNGIILWYSRRGIPRVSTVIIGITSPDRWVCRWSGNSRSCMPMQDGPSTSSSSSAPINVSSVIGGCAQAGRLNRFISPLKPRVLGDPSVKYPIT